NGDGKRAESREQRTENGEQRRGNKEQDREPVPSEFANLLFSILGSLPSADLSVFIRVHPWPISVAGHLIWVRSWWARSRSPFSNSSLLSVASRAGSSLKCHLTTFSIVKGMAT